MACGCFKICWLALIIILSRSIEEIEMCDDEICFSWRQLNQSLVLTCTVSNALYRISIDDPRGESKAHCIPSFTCVKVKSKPSYINRPTNQLVLNIPDPESNQASINGIWSCHHGASRGMAKTKVQFAQTTGIYTTNAIESSTEKSYFDSEQITVLRQVTTAFKTTKNRIPPTNTEKPSSYMGNLLTTNRETAASTKQTLSVPTVKPTDSNSKGALWEALSAFYLVPSVVVLFIVFTICCLCNIWISKKCSSAATTDDVEQIVQRILVINDQRQDIKSTNIQDNTCEEYEYINDENILESVPEVHTMTLADTRIGTDFGLHENQYLEVISGEDTYESVSPKSSSSTENIYCDISYPNSYICNIETETSKCRKNLSLSNIKKIVFQQVPVFTSKSCPELESLKT